ncbi:hypothetical protein FA15DRAFT_759602 [Coprinopsis marcescibilis]|uniref:Uncharacterized protein n=1 Tax=Coprinopsis marcescibilis TaxID=230819 RepID=A0A5C3KJI2_COPMA|nr:hypothetical protein FA15DRAFT_759602 [Coprinopsis marcescibilis]
MSSFIPGDSIDLDRVANVTVASAFVNLTLTMVFVGAQMFMSFYGLTVYLATPEHLQKGRRGYIVLSLVILILFTTLASLDLITLFTVLLKAGSYPGRQLYSVNPTYSDQLISWDGIVQMISTIVFVAASEGLLLYRAFILWRDRWWVCAPLFVLYMASVALVITCYIPVPSIVNNPYLIEAWIILSVILNISTTGVLIFRLVSMNRQIGAVLTFQRPVARMTEKAVVILIESAAPPAVFGLLWVISDLLRWKMGRTTEWLVASQILDKVFSMFYYAFLAMCPQLIIFRITIGRSWLHSTTGYENGSSTMDDDLINGSATYHAPITFAHAIGQLKSESQATQTSSAPFED